VPGAANAPAAIQSELADLNKMMADKDSDYWKGPKSEKLQARWRELFEANERMK